MSVRTAVTRRRQLALWLLCGLSAGPAMLIAARFAQGTGGAMVTAVSLGLGPPTRRRATLAECC
jgi:MFS family permease